MTIFKELYFLLFAAGANALEELEKGNVGLAKSILTEAQQKAEERYLDSEEEIE